MIFYLLVHNTDHIQLNNVILLKCSSIMHCIVQYLAYICIVLFKSNI